MPSSRQRLRLALIAACLLLPAVLSLAPARDPVAIASAHGTVVHVAASPDGVEQHEYFALRDARLDRLLPSAGGGRFLVAGLEQNGLALQRENIILLRAELTEQATEAHELAHLVQYNLPREVAAIMRVMPPPAPDEYAAKSDTEHFAEMASEAWTLLGGVREFCFTDTPAERLRDAEQRVPGTAGFVAYFVATDAFADDSAARSVADLATAMIPPDARPAWAALWTALEARRQPDGTLPPWPRPNAITRHRQHWEHFRTPALRGLMRAFTAPSELVVRAVAG